MRVGQKVTTREEARMPQTLTYDVWMYRDPTLATSLNKQRIVGYEVESIDGSIGKIDDASFETRGSSARRSCCRWACLGASTMRTRRSS